MRHDHRIHRKLVVEELENRLAPASVYYVSPSGDNSNTGAQAEPWATPGYASRQLAPGDTLIILGGRYVLDEFDADIITPPSGTSGAWITIRGEEGNRPILAGGDNLNRGIDLTGANYVRIENLELTHDDQASGSGRYFRDGIVIVGEPTSHVVLEDLYIHHIDEFGMDFQDINDLQVIDCRIEYCGFGAMGGPSASQGGWQNIRIEGCSLSYGGHYYQGGDGSDRPYDRPDGFGIEPSSGPVLIVNTTAEHNYGDGLDSKAGNTTIRDCIVANNSCDGVKLWDGTSRVENTLIYGRGDGDDTPTPWAAIVIGCDRAGAEFEIVNCTVDDATGNNYILYAQYDDPDTPIDLTIRNSIFSGVGPFFLWEGSSLTAENNLFYMPSSTTVLIAGGTEYTADTIGSLGTGNRYGDPLFVSPAWGQTGDYHLRAGSPAIDAGTANDAPTSDLDGNARDESPDIGAYEYSLGTNPDWKWDLWSGGATQLRGANIYQARVYPELDGTEFKGPGPVGPPYAQEDFNALAAMGCNYVNISHPGLFSETAPYVLDADIQQNLDSLLSMIAQADMFAVISFRTGPGRSEFTFLWDENDPWFDESYLNDTVWTDQQAQDAWAQMWRYTAQRYANNPIVVGYDLMVEPNSNDRLLGIWDPDTFYQNYANTLYDWNQMYPEIVDAIREVDVATPILVGGNSYSAVGWLPYLQVDNDPHIVYTIHQYEPFVYTHQETTDNYTYPGTFDADWDDQPDTVDRNWLDNLLSAVDTFMDTNNVPMACNEFGLVRWAPGADEFMDDLMDLLEARGMNHALWLWDPDWQLWNELNDEFTFRHGPNPSNHTDVASSDLMSAITQHWAMNTLRPPDIGPQDIFFLHQSCGEGIMADHGGNPGLVSQLEDLGHTFGDYSLWNSPPGGSVPTEIASLFADTNDDGVYGDAFDSVSALNGARDADILMFKSCFYVLWDLEDPSALASWQEAFINYVAPYANQNPDQKIVAMPGVPLRSEAGLSAAAAARAREWGEWLAGEFITTYCTQNNVYSFDLFDFWADAETHATNANCLKRAYCRSGGDEHPNDAGYSAAADAIVSYLQTTVIPGGGPPPSGPEITVQWGSTNVTDGQTTPISFGSVGEGQSGPTRTFTVRNDGTETLTLGAVSLPAGYTLTEGLSSGLAPGASDTFTVRLDTDAVGTKSGEITFTNNDGSENPFNFAITGTVTSTTVDLTVRIEEVGDWNPVEIGNNLWIALTGTNGSDVGVEQTYRVDLYLSVNTTAGDGDDVLLGSVTDEGLGAQEDRYWDGMFTVLDGTPEGDYYVYASIDVGGDVAESNESNNTGWTDSAVFTLTHGCVLRRGDNRMTFMDGDGDHLMVVYTGPGYAILKDASGGRPDESNGDIASVEIFGNTDRSRLKVRDLDRRDTPNTLMLGVVRTQPGASFGSINLVNPTGQVRNTTIDVAGAMNRLMVVGEASGLSVTVGGDLMQMLLHGRATACDFAIGGDMRKVLLDGGLAGGSLTVSGDLTRSLISRGEVSGTIDVTGSAADSQIKVTGNLSGSLLAGVFGNVTVVGEFSGQIGDAETAAGTGNTLRVTIPGAGGTVTPPDAFESYIGYP